MVRANHVVWFLATVVACSDAHPLAAAEPDSFDGPQSHRYVDPVTFRFRVGVHITAHKETGRFLAACPVPMDWPEQDVRLIKEDRTGNLRVRLRSIDGTARLLFVTAGRMPAGKSAEVVQLYEVTRYRQSSAVDPATLRIPKGRSPQLRSYLKPSPGIEATHPAILDLAEQLDADGQLPWRQIETDYGWIQDNVKYVNGEFKGALRALRDKEGDCEELTSLFIALRRARNIPARTVWVPGHVWAEFYLEDAEGQGQWFPADLTAARQLGQITDYGPILQKGDRFQVAERRGETLRYLSPWVRGLGATPRVEFIEEVLTTPDSGDTTD